jgi:hypothetical protein
LDNTEWKRMTKGKGVERKGRPYTNERTRSRGSFGEGERCRCNVEVGRVEDPREGEEGREEWVQDGRRGNRRVLFELRDEGSDDCI